MSGLLRHSLNIYISGAKGENIEEEDDIDKEIALFKKGLEEDKIKYKKSSAIVEQTLNESIAPFFNFLFEKFNKLNDLFVEVTKVVRLIDDHFFDETERFINQEFGESDIIFLNKELFKERASFDGSFSPTSYYISSFSINITFKGYKKIMPHPTLAIKYMVRFDEYYYSVFHNGIKKHLTQYAYGETLPKETVKEICNNEVRFFLETLKNIPHE